VLKFLRANFPSALYFSFVVRTKMFLKVKSAEHLEATHACVSEANGEENPERREFVGRENECTRIRFDPWLHARTQHVHGYVSLRAHAHATYRKAAAHCNTHVQPADMHRSLLLPLTALKSIRVDIMHRASLLLHSATRQLGDTRAHAHTRADRSVASL
jgi:hypothetical protein